MNMISVNVKTGEVKDLPDTIQLPTAAERQAEADAQATAAAKRELEKIDVQSIRSMREFLLAKFPGDPLLPPILSSHNAAAATERAKIK